MNTDNHNALKKALENRIGDGLPSGFNDRMMGCIRQKVERRRKRNRWISWLCLISASLLLMALGAYILIIELDFDFMQYIPRFEFVKLSKELVLFYWYIALLVFILLGFDYGMRHYKKKATH